MRAGARERIGLSLLAAALLAVPGLAADPAEPPDRRWRDGPVRYLLSDEEYRQYGLLEDPGARLAFIEDLWHRFDPDPSTPENEFKEAYARRTREADERFHEGIVPGWRTDRGRVLLLLGEPATTTRDAGDARAAFREIWTYLRPGSPYPLEVIFYQDSLGGFRLTPESRDPRPLSTAELQIERQRLRRELRYSAPSLSDPALDQIVEAILEPPGNFFNRDLGGLDPPARGSKAERVPPRAAMRQGALIHADDAFFFKATDGSVLTLLALEYEPLKDPPALGPPDPGGRQLAEARVARADGEPIRGDLEIRVPLSPLATFLSTERRQFTGRLFLDPGGLYVVRYAVEDAHRKTLSFRKTFIRAPDFSDALLSVSSVVPADHFGPVPNPQTVSPFAIGSEEVIPRPGGVFSRGETLRLYLQVYGARDDPDTARPKIDVTFTFYRYGKTRLKRHGRPSVIRGAHGASLGLSVPVGDWPVGRYRVRVDLLDRLTSARTSAEADFRITD